MTQSGSRHQGLTMMAVAHRAMIVDLGRIAIAADRLAAATPGPTWPGLRSYARRVVELVEHHHEGEDEHLWPMLHAKGAPTDVLAALEADHAELAVHVVTLHGLLTDAATPGERRCRDLAAAARAVRDELESHTAAEDAALAGPLADLMDDRAWRRFQVAMLTSAPLWSVTFMPAWLASAAVADERPALPGGPAVGLLSRGLRRRRLRAFGPDH